MVEMASLLYRYMSTQRTRSQDRILALLNSLDRPLSAQEVYAEFRQQKQRIGLATVYRALEALKREGVVQVRSLANGEGVYSSVKDDRHHLTCLDCGRSLPIEECPVHQLEVQLQDSYQFKIYYHTLEFFGVCQTCQAGRQIAAT